MARDIFSDIIYYEKLPECRVIVNDGTPHELLHQFGGDASRQFRTAILAMDYRIMQNFRKLEEYESMWRKLE